MADKPHIFDMRLGAIVKLISYSLLAGSVLSLAAYFVFRQSFDALNVIIIGFITGGLIGINFLTDHYRGAYILGGVLGTIGAGVLIAINFEDPLLIGFAPFGGLLGMLIIVLPDDFY